VSGNDVSVINVVAMDDYIKGVIPYEMSPSWPLEALKAQAMCAKCYAVNCLEQRKHRALGFDLCNTTDCQVYYGTNSASSNSDRAVDETAGLYATYQGAVISAYYHASSGGYTEDVENIWGSYVPYLRAVEDTYLVQMRPYSFNISLDDVTRILQAKGRTTRRITDMYVSRYSPSGNVLELSVVEQGGRTLRFSMSDARSILNSTLTADNVKIQSHRYRISGGSSFFINGQRVTQSAQGSYAIGGDGEARQIAVGDVQVMTKDGVSDLQTQATGTGVYTISGTGSGHEIGMSQWGAHAMAELGFTYDEIIKFYYTGVEVGPLG
jgi:stage II sporulation protein D